MARNLTDPFDGFLSTPEYLILDRDPLFMPASANAQGLLHEVQI
jgi:hypothetical protein